MIDTRDLKISRKLQKLMRRVEQLVTKEIGDGVGITLMVHPFAKDEQSAGIREFQYVSNMDRSHMAGAMDALLKKWKAGIPSIPPHEKQ